MIQLANTVYTKIYTAPPIDRREILRYLGARDDAPAVAALVDECICEAEAALSYKVCFCEVDISHIGDALTLGTVKTNSTALEKNLSGCARATVFAATVGVSLDRLIARYSVSSPSKAVVLDAIGSERIEALCDEFCADIKRDTNVVEIRPRFSPGYGDFPLDAQNDIFALLDCPRKIGLTLNKSLIMTPSKSVTAIIGKVIE